MIILKILFIAFAIGLAAALLATLAVSVTAIYQHRLACDREAWGLDKCGESTCAPEIKPLDVAPPGPTVFEDNNWSEE